MKIVHVLTPEAGVDNSSGFFQDIFGWKTIIIKWGKLNLHKIIPSS
jgi:hypothetical protein